MERNGNSRRREEAVVDYKKRSIPPRKDYFDPRMSSANMT
jgi:hypothetical protein